MPADRRSAHDLGADVIPRLAALGDAQVHDFAQNEVPGATGRDRGYRRDVGTLDAYYEASMDLVAVQPVFNLYNLRGPSSRGRSRFRRPSSCSTSPTGGGKPSPRWYAPVVIPYRRERVRPSGGYARTRRSAESPRVECQGSVGDLAPPAVNRQRVSPVRHLHDLRDAVVAFLALV